MRPRKNIIKLDVDSALALMQEIYNDVVEQKNTASTIMRKMLKFMNEAEDMSVIGPVIKEQQKIMNDCTEKKISLVKLQGALLKQQHAMGGGNNQLSGGKLELTDEDRELIEKFAASTSEDTKPSNYKTK